MAVRALVEEGLLPVGLEAGDRPTADVTALLVALAQMEAVLAMRMAQAEAAGALPLLAAGGMASQVYWSRSRARALSRAGHLATNHAEVADRWLAGAITAEHVDAAARGVTRLPDDRARAVIEGLAPAWGRVTPQAVSAYCTRARAIVDPRPDDAELAATKAHEARFLSFSVLDDTVHVTGSLARLDGELLMSTIHATAEKLRAASDGLTAGQRRADALVHLAAAAGALVGGAGPGAEGWATAGASGGAGPGAGSGAGLSAGAGASGGAGPGQGSGAGLLAGAGADRGGPAVGAAPVSITLTAELDAVTEGGLHLGPAATRFVLCDATITPVLVDPPPVPARDDPPPHDPPPHGHPPHGHPPHDPPPHDVPTSTGSPSTPRARLALLAAQALSAPRPVAVGRSQRVATGAQRRALAVRDRGCVMPGCDIPVGQCQVHHLVAWTDGGATDLPNLVSLCWAHHRQVDLGRWDIHPKAAGRAGTPANHGAPFTIALRPRRRWGERPPAG